MSKETSMNRNNPFFKALAPIAKKKAKVQRLERIDVIEEQPQYSTGTVYHDSVNVLYMPTVSVKLTSRRSNKMFTRYLYHIFVFLFVLCGGLALIGAGLAYVLNG